MALDAATISAAKNVQRGSRFVQPVKGGTIGRADQGVDISAPPGSAIVDPVPGTSKLFSTIRNWYQGQSLYAFRVLTGPFKGKAWYEAEQVTPPPPGPVSQGQRIGAIAASGTGTEFGWADPSTGEAAARGHYTEGVPTPEGTDFSTRVKGGTPPIVRPGGDTGGGSGGGGGSDVSKIFVDYQSEINMDRTAPALAGSGWATPFQWWWRSFSGKWEAEQSGAGGDGAASDPTGAGAKILKTITGKGSFFNDGTTATGKSAVSTPGIAVYDQSTLGGWWRVTAPNGVTKLEQQIDIGPAPWTRRIVDIGAAALGDFGYSSNNFPTDQGSWRLDYLGKNKPA